MLSTKNFLILTSKTGGGHISLAESVSDLLEAPGHHAITIVDPQPAFFHLHYRLVSRYALWLWAAEFEFFNTPRRAMAGHRAFTLLVRRRLDALLDRVRPDLVLTTYPFLTYEVMRVLDRRAPGVPLVSLFSDANGVHAAWLSERRVAAVLATTHETYQQAQAAGFSTDHLHLVGWPVRAQFSYAYPAGGEARAARMAQLNLAPDRFTIFLQGGGEGAAHVDRALESLLAACNSGDSNVQVILATGTNRALLERYKNARNIAALPYTKEIAPYMASADVIMGKAGPNTLFESVTLGKPFIATSYIPGQEQANLAFIQRYGLGWIALQAREQRSLLTSLLHDPGQLSAKCASVAAYRAWNAAANQRLVPLLERLVK